MWRAHPVRCDTGATARATLNANRKGDDMKQRIWSFLRSASAIVFAFGVVLNLAPQCLNYSQGRQDPGRSIGTATTQGNLIVMTLNEGALGHANLFDLNRRTLRFTPEGAGYRAENLALQWDSDFGAEIANPQVSLHNFAFPFSGKSWDSFSVGTTGSISFGAPPTNPGVGGGFGGRGGGVSIGRFDQLREAARTLINTAPAICVFLK